MNTRKIKQMLAFLMSVIILLSAIPMMNAFAAISGSCGTALRWVISDSGILTISGIGGIENNNAPWKSYKANIQKVIISNGVISIGNSAFEGCSAITDVELPDSLKSIGSSAFANCTSLTNINIPDSVNAIGASAFYGCSNLESIKLSKNLKSISRNMFYGCSGLTRITIPKGVSNIEPGAFYFCHSLPSISLPDGMLSIADHAFYECNCLTNIAIPKSIISIGDFAFQSCSNLKKVYYSGTEDDWNEISIGSYNTYLVNATRYYNATSEKDVHKHSYTKSVTKKATLSANGEYTYKCACGDKYTKSISQVKTVKLSKTTLQCNGKAQKPSVTVKDANGKTISKSYYTVSYTTNCIDVGTHKVKVTFKSPYKGSKVLSFKITLPTPASLKVNSRTKSSVSLSWDKTKGADEYEIYMSTDGKKWKSVGDTAKTSLTVKKLKASTVYQFKIRAVDATGVYYSAYSPVLKVKTKA